MRSRVLRVGVLVILLASGAGAAYVAWQARATASAASTADIESRVERLLAAVDDLSNAQTVYVAPGQDAAPALERVPDLLRQVAAQTAEAGPLLKAPDAQQDLRSVADATARLAQADATARDNLLLGDTFTAAHILFGEARSALATMATSLDRVRRAERERAQTTIAAANNRTEFVVGGVALLWLAGVLLLVAAPTVQHDASRPIAEPEPVAAPVPAEPALPPSPRSAIDVLAAADVCASIARVEDTAELTVLLQRAADLIAASELVVWLRGGDQLFASLVHGGGDDGKARLPLRRSDDSVAVRAWLSSHVELSEAADSADGVDVIAAPMVGPAGASGVLTVSLRPKGVADDTTKAVVVMIAAQLSTVVAARPASDAGVAFATGT